MNLNTLHFAQIVKEKGGGLMYFREMPTHLWAYDIKNHQMALLGAGKQTPPRFDFFEISKTDKGKWMVRQLRNDSPRPVDENWIYAGNEVNEDLERIFGNGDAILNKHLRVSGVQADLSGETR